MLLLEHDNGSPEHLRIERGREAWNRLQKDQTWEDWMTVAVAVDIGRQHALNISGKNAPGGKGYNKAFSNWLKENGFDNIDGAARKHMLDCFDQRGAIEKWRAILTTTQRLKINHPTTVWRNWQSSIHEPKPKAERKPSKQQQTEDALQTMHEAFDMEHKENERLKAHVEELESAREEPATVSIDDIRLALIDHLRSMPTSQVRGFLDEFIDGVLSEVSPIGPTTSTPKRKGKGGRPKGSKNKPKPVPASAADGYDDLPPVTFPEAAQD